MRTVAGRIITIVLTAAVSVGAIAPAASAGGPGWDPSPMCVTVNAHTACVGA